LRIAAIADTHGLKFKRPWANVFIHGGDMTAWGEYRETLNLGRELSSLETDEGMPPYDEVVIVPGNHDRALEQIRQSEYWTFGPHVHLLIDQTWEYGGLVFYGTPWTPWFEGVNEHWTAFMRSEDELRNRFENIPAEVDVLITHGPPKGILDMGKGSEALREAIERRRIRVHLFGHIHECGGRFEVNYPQDGGTRESFNISAIYQERQPAAGTKPREYAREPVELEMGKNRDEGLGTSHPTDDGPVCGDPGRD